MSLRLRETARHSTFLHARDRAYSLMAVQAGLKSPPDDNMKYRRIEQHSPRNAEQMFDLVADIERYHEFLPGWSHARITQRHGDVLTVAQGIDLGILHLEFESRAELHRPERLRVSSSGGPFRQLLLDWRFLPHADGGCTITLAASLEMRLPPVEAVSGRLLDLLTRDIVRRFHARAADVYGN
jgi:coenzyme Q-binding protein COQ10